MPSLDWVASLPPLNSLCRICGSPCYVPYQTHKPDESGKAHKEEANKYHKARKESEDEKKK